MKTIIISAALILGYATAFAQDTTYQNKDHIRLPENNKAITIAPTAAGPDQGGEQENQRWYKIDSTDNASYCMLMDGGRLRLQKNGKDIKKGIILMDGSRITTAGYITRKNHNNTQLKAGECITRDGMVKPKDSK